VIASALVATSATSTSGFISDVVKAAPTVRTEDASGHALPGAPVTFTVTAGDGSVAVTTVTTDAAGLATTAWTLGPARGTDNNTLTATTTGPGGKLLTVSFTATGLDPICDVPATASPFQSGDGTAAAPYQICTPEQFQAIGADAAHWSANYRLAADLDMAAYDGNSAATTYNIIGTTATPFTGSFDGAGHTIAHLTINAADANAGMFGVVDGSEIKSLTLTDASLTVTVAGKNDFGLISGQATDAQVHDITVSGRVNDNTGTATNVGGLFGQTSIQSASLRQTYSNIAATVVLRGTNDGIGGIFGLIQVSNGAALTIQKVTATADILGDVNSGNTYGGFAAYVKVGTGGSIVFQDIATKGGTVIPHNGSYSGAFIGTAGADGIGSALTMKRVASDMSLTTTDDFFVNRGSSGGFIGIFGIAHGATITVSECRQTGHYNDTNTVNPTAKHGSLFGYAGLTDAGSSLVVQDVYVDDGMSFAGSQGHNGISLGIGVLSMPVGTTLTVSRVYTTGSIAGTALTAVGGFLGEASLAGTVNLTDVFYDSDAEAQGYGQGADPTGLSGKSRAQLKTPATYAGWDPAIWNIQDGAMPTLKALPPP